MWYGFHYIDGRKVTSKDSLTRTQADKLLVKKIESHQTRKQKINIPLNKEQQTALTSFEYNVGSNIRNTDSGNKIIASIEENNLQEATQIMSRFVVSNGKKLSWLIKRRWEEGKLLLGDAIV